MRNDNAPDPIIEKYRRLSPELIIAEVGDDAILNRLGFLEKVYNEFADQWRGLYLNPYLLREMVESYYCDIYRLKFFRPVNRINAAKKAAYTMKWISRIRPIQLREGAGPDSATIMVNAYYAVMAGFALLDIDVDVKNDEWWANYITESTYRLHFHSVSVESLYSEMGVLLALSQTKKAE